MRPGPRRSRWLALTLLVFPSLARAEDAFFTRAIAPILEQHCLRCHGAAVKKGGLSLATAQGLAEGGDTGAVIAPGKPDESPLIQAVSGAKPRMPRGARPLTADQVAALRRWVAEGARWPDGVTLKDRQPDGEGWWSLAPLTAPPVPAVKTAGWVRNPVDAFILARLEREGLRPSPEADPRTLIRRLTFDLHGLPPTPEEVEAFLREVGAKPQAAYEALVDRLLASPRYGERWGRHWLDVVHYGDTHGYDKDKLRPNAWPYRDYVIQSLNADKPYRRFVEEQIAGDVLYPGTRDGVVALGFLAAGPWDFVGQVELREGTLDKKITRTLDRDDMVATAMNTFTSLTVQCARCHDHKFDPIRQEDYYSLQAVFAGVDRADRPFDDPAAAARRAELARRQADLDRRQQALEAQIQERAGAALGEIDGRIAALAAQAAGPERGEFGYHSQIEPVPTKAKWVQVDLGTSTPIAAVVWVGCHDTFNGIGAGFGYPVRFKVEVSDDPDFRRAVTVADHTQADAPNPGVTPQSAAVGATARYVRVTATRLAHRAGDYIFALAELAVFTPEGRNAAAGAAVTALDSIEAAPRWRKANLVDGVYYRGKVTERLAELAQAQEQRRQLLERVAAPVRQELASVAEARKQLAAELAGLPPPQLVFAAATHFAPAGSFTPTQGKPRPVHLLKRGSENSPGPEMGPGTVACVQGLASRFTAATEGERRAALARWIVDGRNPLTWRSVVNRVWQYHFGQGLVETPNDFGRMGGKPSHPELLDWLAVNFRDGGQSLKELHRLLVTSAAYRQTSAERGTRSAERPEQAGLEVPRSALRDPRSVDAGNRLLWRMNRRRLEAEAIRDAVLAVSGQLDLKMGGPGFRPFGFKDDHSPHYKYEEHDPDDPAARRRSVYRFLVRSVPDPFMETLDCADPSLIVERRNETLTALQALSLLNNKFMVRMAAHFAERAAKLGPDLPAQTAAAFRLALGRAPTADEAAVLTDLARRHGLAHACRLLFNANEFCFVD